MSTEPNRQPEGIPTGGQFAKKTQSDDVPALPAAHKPGEEVARPATCKHCGEPIEQRSFQTHDPDRPRHAWAHVEGGLESCPLPHGASFAAPSGFVPALTPAAPEFNFDTPEDEERFNQAAEFMADAGIEGKVSPMFTQYRPTDLLDTVLLEVDGRTMLVRHVGTVSPQIEYGDDEDDAWTFRSGPGDTTNKTEHEILAKLVTGARHDAACQEAWRRDPSGETFQYGEDVNVNDFGVRFDDGGTRIITLDIDKDGRHWELVQRGNEDVKVFLEGSEVPLPHIQLDALAFEFDEDHSEGMGDITWKVMMKAAADRAAKDPGYNPRGINR